MAQQHHMPIEKAGLKSNQRRISKRQRVKGTRQSGNQATRQRGPAETIREDQE
ncbi:MAG: hypothetical protein Q9225_003274 [Loekoesia sp. 1 TL-2023]